MELNYDFQDNIKLYHASKYEYAMELLAAMTASEIAKRHNISKVFYSIKNCGYAF